MSDADGSELDAKWWYNEKTGAVEQGFKSPHADRLGPFDTREEAEHAWDTVRARSEQWAKDDD